ncbi:MAG: methyltransferase domain-containing protein [Deltaproteobacteria bacterium]
MFKKIVNKVRHNSRLKKLKQVDECLRPSSVDAVLEVGVANIEYSQVDNFLIKKYNHPKNLTALGIGDLSEFRKRYPNIRVVSYDGGIFPFHDKEFDIAHSNAVIEHVGSREAQECFLREIVRVSRRGMMTTPNRRFIFETHTRVPFMHWMGKEWFDRFLKVIGKGWAAGGYMHLLSFRELDSMAKRAGIKNYRIIRNRFFGFTMTFSLIWNESN